MSVAATAGPDAGRGPDVTATGARPLALLFPGQGSQHIGMAAGLYPHDPVFTAAIDEVFAAMGAEGSRLRADWLTDRPTIDLDHVTRSQPLLFAVDYALGRLVLSWGASPAAMLGHSIGEVAAATLAGVFTLADAVRLVLDRVWRLADAPAGGMLAVAASRDEVAGFLTGDVVVGAINAPRQTILAGPDAPLDSVAAALREQGFTCRRVPSLSAFHSPVLAAASSGAEALIASVAISDPTVTVYSGYTAAPLRHEDVNDPLFWTEQPVRPVLFWPALEALLSTGDYVLVEAGPGQGLAQVARRHRAVRTGRSAVVPLLPTRPGPPEADRAAVRDAVEALVANGLIDARGR